MAGTLRPVAKRSVGKPSRGGRKWAARQLDDSGTAVRELVTDKPDLTHRGRQLLHLLVRDGTVIGGEHLGAARERHKRAAAELPAHAHQMSRGYPAIPTVFEPDSD